MMKKAPLCFIAADISTEFGEVTKDHQKYQGATSGLVITEWDLL